MEIVIDRKIKDFTFSEKLSLERIANEYGAKKGGVRKDKRISLIVPSMINHKYINFEKIIGDLKEIKLNIFIAYK